MIQIIIGVILSGCILCMADFVVLSSLSNQFFMCVGIAAALFAFGWVSPSRSQWVFLRHINGDEFKWWEYASTFFAMSLAVMALLHLTQTYQVPTLIATCLLSITFSSWWPWLKGKYAEARTKRIEKMENYQPPVPISEQLSRRTQAESASPSQEIQDAALNEILEDCQGL